eukprot:1392126-Amorphochlora_amoeboformis.AAC.1
MVLTRINFPDFPGSPDVFRGLPGIFGIEKMETAEPAEALLVEIAETKKVINTLTLKGSRRRYDGRGL